MVSVITVQLCRKENNLQLCSFYVTLQEVDDEVTEIRRWLFSRELSRKATLMGHRFTVCD